MTNSALSHCLNRLKISLPLVAALLAAACAATSHPEVPARFETTVRPAPDAWTRLQKVLDQPGPIELETVESAAWSVERSGLINLEHPTARSAGLDDSLEPISLFFHVVRHPERGDYIVETGVERRFRGSLGATDLSAVLRLFAGLERLEVKRTLGEHLAEERITPQGAFLTHLHLDHVLGIPDLPKNTPLYAGPGETEEAHLMHGFSQGTLDRIFHGRPALRVMNFEQTPNSGIPGVLDIFGDGTFWALWAPGHTPGSVAYLVRTPKGPVMLLGDVSHTRWGWEHDVEPGSFSHDPDQARVAFGALKDLLRGNEAVRVVPGHQW